MRIAVVCFLISSILVVSGCSARDAISVDLEAAQDDAQVVIRGRTGATSYEVPIIDPLSHALIEVDFEHYEVHEGHSYFISSVVDLGNGANRTFLIITPDTTTWAHIVREIDVELETSFKFYEGGTVSNNGTSILAINRNRNSSNTAGVLFFHTPTQTDYGTLIGQSHIGSGKKAGGGGRDVNEIILRQGTHYMFVAKNETANNNLISGQISWYEHSSDEH